MSSHRLLLIRHAKTEQGSPDEQRELTDRGRRDAAALGECLAEMAVVPDLVVVSPATRARQTWELVGSDAPVTVDERIYDNSFADLLRIVRETAESVGTLAIVGHNPSIEECTIRHGGPDDIPTATVVVLDVDGSWQDGALRFAELTTCRG